MADRQRPPAESHPRSVEELWAELIRTSIICNGGKRFGGYLPVFAPRVFIRGGVWRIPEPEDPEAFARAYHRGDLSQLETRIDHMKRASGLEPFPSSPTRPPVYVVRFSHADRLNVASFCLTGPARVFIEEVIEGFDYTWKSSNHFYVPELELTVSSDKLEDIMESTDSFTLPDPYPAWARAIRQRWHDNPQPVEREKPTGGGMTAADIAQRLELAPSKVRQVLRKKGVKKPYSWAPDEFERILGLFK